MWSRKVWARKRMVYESPRINWIWNHLAQVSYCRHASVVDYATVRRPRDHLPGKLVSWIDPTCIQNSLHGGTFSWIVACQFSKKYSKIEDSSPFFSCNRLNVICLYKSLIGPEVFRVSRRNSVPVPSFFFASYRSTVLFRVSSVFRRFQVTQRWG